MDALVFHKNTFAFMIPPLTDEQVQEWIEASASSRVAYLEYDGNYPPPMIFRNVVYGFTDGDGI